MGWINPYLVGDHYSVDVRAGTGAFFCFTADTRRPAPFGFVDAAAVGVAVFPTALFPLAGLAGLAFAGSDTAGSKVSITDAVGAFAVRGAVCTPSFFLAGFIAAASACAGTFAGSGFGSGATISA